MSLGYASRLSDREDLGGRLGDPEIFDRPADVVAKAGQLADMISTAGTMMAFTGAGISTSCGIPDFRGPQGIWTLQRKGAPLPSLATTFAAARPGLTHAALLGLMRAGKLVYICSQNVDSLHLRSGVPRAQLAELHGNCFAERCTRCGTEYVREFEMDTVGFKPTGRRCARRGCGCPLADHILDWEDALPPAELAASERHASAVGLSLCLGTSLQIVPAANLPLRTLKTGGALAIINLQATPKDKRANLVVHAKVDTVMSLVMQRLGIPLPTYTRTDHVLLSFTTCSTSSNTTNNTSVSNGNHKQEEPSNGEAARRPRRGTAAAEAQEAAAAARDPPGVACEAGAITCSTCGRRVMAAATSHASSSWGPELQAAAAAAAGAAAAGGSSGADSSHPSNPSSGGWSFELVLGSPAGQQWPLPLVSAVRAVFPGPPPPSAGGREGGEAGPGGRGAPRTSSSGVAGLAPARVEGPAPFRIQRHVACGGTPAQGHPPNPGAAADAAGVVQSHEAVEEGAAAAEQVSGAEGAGAAGGPCCVVVQLELELVASAADAERRYVQVPYLVVRDWAAGVTTPHPAGDTHTRLPGHLVSFNSQVIDYSPQQHQLVEELLAAAAADPLPTPPPPPAASKGRKPQQQQQQQQQQQRDPQEGHSAGQGPADREQAISSEEEEDTEDDSEDSDYKGEALPAVSATRRGRAVRRPTKYARKQ